MSETWTPPGNNPNRWIRYLLLAAALAYVAAGLLSIEVRWDRVVLGVERAGRFFAGFIRPDFVSRDTVILEGILESLTMTVVSTVFGIILSVPVALGAARNIAPTPVYLFCRGIVTLSRTFQEVIIAILFVVIFGFGPFAGVMTLSFTTILFWRNCSRRTSRKSTRYSWRQFALPVRVGCSWYSSPFDPR